MGKKLVKGIDLLDEIEGTDAPAVKGSRGRYCARMYLRKGDEVTFDSEMISNYPEHLTIKVIEGE